MSDTQINVGMNVDGVIAGTDKAKRKISELGGSARDAGNEAAKGMASIGNGGEAASRKVEAATKNTINSIQRQIAAFEAGDKSSRKYQESLARMRGIDVAALKPYLDQLDQVKLKQNAMVSSQDGITSSFGSMKMAAFAAAAALGAMGLAFKNIVNGVDALNDLKDATGASIENISALEDVALRTGTSFDTVGAALIKFNGVLKDNKAGTATAEAFKAIGVSVDELKALDPAEALRKVAVAFSGFADDGNKARIMQELFGKSTRDVAALMKDLAEKGQLVATVTTEQADEAEKLNKEFAAMSKNVTDLARDIAGPLVSAFNEFIKKQREAKENGKFGLFTSPIQAELDYNSNKRTGSWSEPGNAGRGNVNPESVKPALAGLPDTASIKAAASASAKALAEQNKELETQAGLLLELSGYSKSYTEDVQRLVAMRKEGALTEAAYSQAVTDLIAKQPVMVAQAKAQAEAQKELNKALDEFASANSKALASASDEVSKAQASYDAHGKLASVLQEEALARLENWRIITSMGGEDTGVLDAQIAAKKELIQILRNGEVRDASEQAAKDMLADQKKAAEESGKYWEDALMRAFESGKGFFQSLWDTIKNTLKTQVLKVLVQGTMSTLGIGAAGAANAAGLGGGTDILGLANMASSVSSAYNGISGLMSIGSQTLAGTMSAANALGTIAANATGTGITGLLATNGAYGTAAAGGLTSGLAAIPGWGWAALGIAALAGSGLFDGGGGPKTESSYGNMAGLGNISAGGLAGTFSTGVEAAWNTLAKQLDLSTSLKVGAFTGIDSAGDAMTQFNTSATVNGVGVYSRGERMGGYENVGRSEEALQAAMTEETTRLLFAALKASDISGEIKTYLGGIADDVTAMNEAMGKVVVVQDFTRALNKLPFNNLKWLSFDAANGLMTLTGGLESFSAQINAYYQAYYSETERAAISMQSLTDALAMVNVELPASKSAFRSVIDGLDLTTESGRNAYAVMLALAPEFDAAAQAADRMAQATAAAIIKTFTGNRQLVPVLNAAALAIGDVAEGAGSMTTGLSYINKVMGDSKSGVITLGGVIGTLGTGMTQSQKSAALLAAQIADLEDNADRARINFAGLGEALANVDTATFVATVALMFENLADRIGNVLDGISAERIAVREAALQIINPTVMSKEQIAQGIAGINTGLPNNLGAVAAQQSVASADANVRAKADALNYAKSLTPSTTALDAARAALDAAKAATAVQQAGIDRYMTIEGGRFAWWVQQAQAGNDLRGSVPNPSAEYYAQSYVFDKNAATAAQGPAQTAYDTQLAAYSNAVAVNAVKVAEAQAALTVATAAQSASSSAAKKAALDYAAALQTFAIDAGKSVTKLGRLREETVKYYEAQKALADLMGNSAAGLRKSVADYRYGQLSPEQQLASLQSQFSSAYSMALASQGDGATLAGYGDKLNSLLGPLIDKLGETGGSNLVGNYLAQAESIASLIESTIPVNYQQDSLDLLGSIDVTLAALEESSMSAEAIISNAVAAGADRTATGLRTIGEAISGKSIPAFALGGSFGGGVRLVGENGPELEVTGPSRIFSADQTRSMLGGNTARLEALVERLTQKVEDLNAAAQATAGYTNKTAKLLDRAMPDGDALATRVAA
jgi:hypothetical protein